METTLQKLWVFRPKEQILPVFCVVQVWRMIVSCGILLMVAVQNIMSIFREITVPTVLQTEHKPLRSGPKLNAVSGKSASSVTSYLNVYQLSFSYDKQKKKPNPLSKKQAQNKMCKIVY